MTFRHKIENGLNKAQFAAFTGTDAQKGFHKLCEDSMRTKLATRPDILDALLPEFPPGCKQIYGPHHIGRYVQAIAPYCVPR